MVSQGKAFKAVLYEDHGTLHTQGKGRQDKEGKKRNGK